MAHDDVGTARWYLVQTKTQQEWRAESNLKSWGVETFAPRRLDVDVRRSVIDVVNRIQPLFPGYLFARFDAARLLSKVRLTRGVRSVVGFGESATPVDDGIVTLIRDRLDAHGFVACDEPREGDRVQIVAGPFRSMSAVFARDLPGRARVVLLLSTLGVQTRVNVAKAHIQKSLSSVA